MKTESVSFFNVTQSRRSFVVVMRAATSAKGEMCNFRMCFL